MTSMICKSAFCPKDQVHITESSTGGVVFITNPNPVEDVKFIDHRNPQPKHSGKVVYDSLCRNKE